MADTEFKPLTDSTPKSIRFSQPSFTKTTEGVVCVCVCVCVCEAQE